LQAPLTQDPSVKVELVTPGSFPPPDLVWFEGNFDDPSYRSRALGANAQVEDLARKSGLAPGWDAPDSDRIFPLVWAPWAWWKTAVAVASTEQDRAALARVEEETSGPTLGEAGETPVSPPRLVDAEGRVWANSLTVAASAPSADPQPAPVVAARVRGFWWNSEGWNRDKVPGVLAKLWSPAAQNAAVEPGWWSVTAPGRLSSATRILLLP
ncbi:MAG TPA: hypothetical protein VMB23_01265, partial [Spirochaetia bacterium]|nr:hypothetical protein [Spirochaetia bacterium]